MLAVPGLAHAAPETALSRATPNERVAELPADEASLPARAGLLPVWIAPSGIVGSWATYEVRARLGAMMSYWLTDYVNRFLGYFAPDGHGPMPGPARFQVLAVAPVNGEESSGYGYRRHPITKKYRLHKGVDFKAKRGTPVYAAGPGVVTTARRKGSYGRLIVISHGMGLETRYAHLQRIKIKERQFVAAGELIGTVGSSGRTTGPHLHFEVRQFDEPVDPRWALGMIETPWLPDPQTPESEAAAAQNSADNPLERLFALPAQWGWQ